MSSLNPLRIALTSSQEAHLWVVATDHLPITSDSQLLDKLSPSEQHHYHSLRIATVKRQYLITRALIRSALSYYADVAPLDWEFIANQYGRPQLAEKFADLQLNFNISHSHGAVACLIACQHRVGLDIEARNRKTNFVEFADQVLSTYEQTMLNATNNIHFLHYWTLKEAYSKALGLGLSMDFKNIVCVLDGSDDVPLLLSSDRFTPLSKNDWQFIQTPLLEHHLLAIAIGKATPNDIAVRRMNVEPGFDCAQPGTLLTNASHDVPRLLSCHPS